MSPSASWVVFHWFIYDSLYNFIIFQGHRADATTSAGQADVTSEATYGEAGKVPVHCVQATEPSADKAKASRSQQEEASQAVECRALNQSHSPQPPLESWAHSLIWTPSPLSNSRSTCSLYNSLMRGKRWRHTLPVLQTSPSSEWTCPGVRVDMPSSKHGLIYCNIHL